MIGCQVARAQCSNAITIFPFTENFESSNGGFTVGGGNPSWAYGTPAKVVISTAGSGTKCWITGGLSGSAYNNNENSTLTSPCFNLGSLINPAVSFKVFWETENRYDGASFQYSDDGGASWITLGTANETTCTTTNWYNTASVTTLGSAGWTGNIQPTAQCTGGAGGGSGRWVTARHSIAALAGKTSVLFRFRFAAGSQCNSYNGFAIDDFTVADVPVNNTADFTFACAAGNQVQFTNASSPCAAAYTWNFGDPVSGAANGSNLENPAHTYTVPGSYTVTLLTTFTGGATATASKTIQVVQATPYFIEDILCFGGSNGRISVNVQPAGSYTYQWNTSPVQATPEAVNLGAGTYTVTVSGAGVCPVQASLTVTQPSRLAADLAQQNALCGRNNGYIQAAVSGGISPYRYQWSNGAITNALQFITGGRYTLRITDDNGCTLDTFAVIRDSVNNIRLNLGNDTFFCPGNRLVLQPGNFAAYQWQDLSTGPTFTVTQTGDYAVKVTDADGCTASDAIKVTVDCSDVYFPSGFTPNGDGRNDGFGPVGNVGALRNYRLEVYGRWGERLFSSTDPFAKWKGDYRGNRLDGGTYVWVATYSLNNRPQQVQKGAVVLIR